MNSTRERAYYERQRRTTTQKENTLMKTIIKQTLICIAVTVIILGIKLINNDTSKVISSSVKNTLYFTVDYQTTANEIFNQIKKIPQLWNKDAKDIDNNDTNTQPNPTEAPVEANQTS